VVGDGDIAPGFRGDSGHRQRRAQEPVGVADVGEVVHDVFAAVCDADGDRAVGHAVLTDWRLGDQPPARAQDPQSSTLIDSH
jgi:hypothetical protein